MFLVWMVIVINAQSLIVLMAFGALHPLPRYDQNDEIERNALHKKSERHKRPWVPKDCLIFRALEARGIRWITLGTFNFICLAPWVPNPFFFIFIVDLLAK